MANNLIKEYWSSTIEENLFESNDFWNQSTDLSEWSDNGKIHIPNAGGLQTYTINPSVYPLPISGRNDTSIDITLDNYASNVWSIQDAEKIFINYDKVKSMVYSLDMGLKQLLANSTPYKWATGISGNAAYFVKTSGAASASFLPQYAGNIATGTRNAPALIDIASVKQLLDQQFVEDDGERRALYPTVMWNNGILGLANIIQNFQYDMSRPVLPTGGAVPIYGFITYVRPDVLYTDANGVLLAINSSTGLPQTPGLTDCAAAIFWHPKYVAKAFNRTQVYYEAGRPEIQGDLMSIRVIYGAGYLRSDLKGVVMLVMA